jgi:hypothetical protein
MSTNLETKQHTCNMRYSTFPKARSKNTCINITNQVLRLKRQSQYTRKKWKSIDVQSYLSRSSSTFSSWNSNSNKYNASTSLEPCFPNFTHPCGSTTWFTWESLGQFITTRINWSKFLESKWHCLRLVIKPAIVKTLLISIWLPTMLKFCCTKNPIIGY